MSEKISITDCAGVTVIPLEHEALVRHIEAQAKRIEALEAALRKIDLWTDEPVSHASYIKAEIRAALPKP